MQYNSANINILTRMKDKIFHFLRRDFEELKLLQSSYNSTLPYAEATQRKLESLLLAELKKARPNFGILSKCSGESKGVDERFRWVLNTISDINNFAHALPFSTISIALEEIKTAKEAQAIVAFVYVIGTNEAYYAEKGSGAWVENNDMSQNINYSRIRVSTRKNKEDLLIATTNQFADIQTLNFNSNIIPLLSLATGKIDAVEIQGADQTEISAPALLVNEAGGYIEIEKKANKYNIFSTNSCCDNMVKNLRANRK